MKTKLTPPQEKTLEYDFPYIPGSVGILQYYGDAAVWCSAELV